jgi:Putative Ig domain
MLIQSWSALALTLAGGVWLAACSESTPTPTGAAMAAAPGSASARDVASNTAPQISSVSLQPSRPQPGTTVQARAEVADADGDTVRVRYEWHTDGVRVAGGQDGSLLVTEPLRKGAVLSVSAIASDGQAESEPATADVRIGNRQPAVTGVRFEPTDGIKPGETVVAVADGEDLDGDALDFHYEWRVGGAVQSGDRERFDTSKLKRGDRLSVRVIASDGDDESTPFESQYLELGNSAPAIVSQPSPGMGADGVYHYGVEASDPDGDRNLRFRLAKAPEGVGVDPLSGEVTWKPSAAQAGVHPIEVVVSDGRGGETKQTFEVTVREVVEKADAAATPPPASAAP